jgi:UDP-N-acetylglucosamine--N-acetylmuramyl-(pentapeptide) pyrophosphoryl-undecaprenol N-acetylglucosamine transferase
VFSKGGFVAFPVVVGAWLNRIPIVAHESDMTPGLANRLSYPFVNKICLTFEGGKKHFKRPEKITVTGTPIREELFLGNREKGLQLCGFNENKPCLLVIGGSQGAGSINTAVRGALKQVLNDFQVIHLCGKGKLDNSLNGREGYFQLEYANAELADLLAASDVVLSRSGANSLYEILALSKPHLLVPLSAKVSRGDQIQNANYFKSKGISLVIADEELSPESLRIVLNELVANKEEIEKKIKALKIESATPKIVALIKEQAHVQSPRTV